MKSVTIPLLLTTALVASFVGASDASVIREVHKRFLFTTYDCQKCYNCACKLTDCPGWNPLEFSGAFFQCSTKVHDADCNAPFQQHGQWSEWGAWSDCYSGRECLSNGRTRTRTCTNPLPKNCGETCVGTDKDVDNTCVPSLCQFIAGLGLVPLSSTLPTTDHKTSSTETMPSSTVSSTTPTTTVKASTTLHTFPPTSSSPTPFVTTSCSKFCAITAVADQLSVTNVGASPCTDNTTGSSEALLMSCCGLSNTKWLHRGPNIMTDCGAIPKYSPVAAFAQGVIQPGSEAIFISCLQLPETGIKIIRQDCIEAPSIIHVNSTQTVYPSPDTYFVIS